MSGKQVQHTRKGEKKISDSIDDEVLGRSDTFQSPRFLIPFLYSIMFKA